MQGKKKNPFACMDIYQNEEGFTFITYFLALSLIAITIPFFSYILNMLNEPSTYSTQTIHTFSHFSREEVIRAEHYEISNNQLSLFLHDGSTATYHQYNNAIRRQVNGEGHEIYVMDVNDLRFIPLPYGFKMHITTKQGELHEKTIVFYE